MYTTHISYMCVYVHIPHIKLYMYIYIIYVYIYHIYKSYIAIYVCVSVCNLELNL